MFGGSAIIGSEFSANALIFPKVVSDILVSPFLIDFVDILILTKVPIKKLCVNLRLKKLVLLNTGMNSRFRNGYKPSRVSFVTSSEKLIHTVNPQRR
jgi:hypothetical protein